MTVEKLKAEIKIKFGTMSKFARIVKIDRYELQKILKRDKAEEIKKINSLAKKKKYKPTGKELTDKQRAALKKAIDKKGGVLQFCRDNPQFSKDSVFQTINGTRKLMTDKKKELFEFLNI